VKIIDRLLASKFFCTIICIGIPIAFMSFGESYNAKREWKENTNRYYIVSVHDTEPTCAWGDYKFIDFNKARDFAREMSKINTVSEVRLYNKTWCFEPTYFKGDIHCPTNGEQPDVWDRLNQ
jgi:hypothetical protein